MMTQPVQDMENADTQNAFFNGLKPANQEHLKPLSLYSRMIACDQKASVHQFCSPFINFKFEVLNNCERKRKLDDSCFDESFKTPAKKVFRPQALSPDLGCFVDTPPARHDPAITCERKQTVSSQLCSEQVECGENFNWPHSLKCEKVLNIAPAFDFDVDDILCLNPFGTTAERLSDNEERCKIPVGNIFSEVPEDECQPESCQKQVSPSGQHSSFIVNDLDAILSGPLLEPVKSPVEPLEGDMDELWNFGLPIFESSMCHSVTVKLNASSDQSRQVSEEVQGGMMEPIHECQATLGGEESTLDTSYETTLPLQVQVKSVVVALGQHPPSSKSAAAPLSKQTAKPTKPRPRESKVSQTSNCVTSLKSQRPVIQEVDLERDKRMYLHSVTRHMNENPGADQDVMTELLNLMTHVADQTPGTNNPQWQHPSDLTRRNYQQQFGNLIPSKTLHEWQNKNNKTHKRFAKVPKIFQRSRFL